MQNSFFDSSVDAASIRRRVLELDSAKVGFYSVGLYPASLAYNCAMQNAAGRLMLAARPGRDLLGAFNQDAIDSMDTGHVETVIGMGTSTKAGGQVPNTLQDLIERCELVVLSANSNHVEEDLQEACRLREELGRDQVVLACLAGSFNHDPISNTAYVLCEKQPNLAFFSGFHRHGALRNPFDSFTANFCHPNALTAMLGAQLLDRLSPNIQVAAGVHNVEGQYIKAAKNMASVFAGFGYAYHQDNPGVLPTLLTLLLDQCLDQAATVSMAHRSTEALPPPADSADGARLRSPVEATLVQDGDFEKVRDHTFSQLTAMVADVRGNMLPVSSSPPATSWLVRPWLENAGIGALPASMEELEAWCEEAGLRKGALEGLKSLRYWPLIARQYAIPIHDASMVNLLYMAIYGRPAVKERPIG